MLSKPDRSRRDVLSIAVVVLLAGWFGFNWFSTLAHIIRYYNPLPVSDYWRVVEDLPALQAGNFDWLWRQHNEHRIVFPEIVFALDELLFSGRQVLPLVISFFCYAGTVTLVGFTFWRGTGLSTRAKTHALLLGGVIAGWPLSAFVLGTPFLLQWTLVQLAVVLALISISKVNVTAGRGWLIVSIGCAVVTTFSSANGLVLWPILLISARYVSARRTRLIAIAVAAAGSAGLFFAGYQRPSASLLFALQHPIYCTGFVVSYVSMPFGVLRNPVFGIAFGLVGLTVWLLCFARGFQTRDRAVLLWEVVSFGYFVFLTLTAALTSLGRADLTDLGFSGAKAARYVTLPLVGWAVLVLLAMAFSFTQKWKLFSPPVILLSTALVIGFMEVRLGRWLRTNDDYVSHQQWTAVSLQNGLVDPALLGSVFPKQAFIERYLPILRASHKSIYSEREASFAGQRFELLFPQVRTDLESGGVVRITPVEGGVSIVGWAANLGRGGRNTVIFASGLGTIVGFGRHLSAGTPRELLPTAAKAAQIWVGFINSSYGTRSFVPYLAVPETGSASPLAREIKIAATSGAPPPI